MIDILFRKHYLSGKQKRLSKVSIGPTAHYRHTELHSILGNDIESFIEIRNRLAHGQWHAALNNEGTAKSPDITRRLWTLTKQDLLLVRDIIQHFAWVMNDFACSKQRFELRYDKLINRIDESRSENQQRFDWIIKHLDQNRAIRGNLGIK